MTQFGETLFRPSRFVRWTLSPFLVGTGVIIPTAIDRWTLPNVGLLVCIEGILVSLLAGFWLPPRFAHGAFRATAGLVFLGFAAYVIDTLRPEYGVPPFRSRGEASLTNAVLGLLAIGMPCLWYCLRGRFTNRPAGDE